jgi:hypothetical protein
MAMTEDFLANIIADSVNPDGNRITTFLLKYPRFIHSEVMTHRALSRNSASSRAIPIFRTINTVLNSPAMPVRWGLNGTGMKDHGKLDPVLEEASKRKWIYGSKMAVSVARELESIGLHKQVSNRVLEPYLWMTTLVTATDYDNFFALRLHKDAQPEFQKLAYMMGKQYLGHTPKQIPWGKWHLPFDGMFPEGTDEQSAIKVIVARAAWNSYDKFGKEASLEDCADMHDRILASGHMSPLEHPAQAKKGRYANLNGWQSYRMQQPNETRKADLAQLIKDYEDANPIPQIPQDAAS